MLFVANLWKKLRVWAVCVRDVHRTLDRLSTPTSGSGLPGTPCRRRGSKCKGLFYVLRSGADFEARRWSMDGADLKALEVFFGECSTTGKAVTQDPGGSFLYRPAMRFTRVAKKK